MSNIFKALANKSSITTQLKYEEWVLQNEEIINYFLQGLQQLDNQQMCEVQDEEIMKLMFYYWGNDNRSPIPDRRASVAEYATVEKCESNFKNYVLRFDRSPKSEDDEYIDDEIDVDWWVHRAEINDLIIKYQLPLSINFIANLQQLYMPPGVKYI